MAVAQYGMASAHFTGLSQFPFVAVVCGTAKPCRQHWFVALAERFSSLPIWVALSAQIGSTADGSAAQHLGGDAGVLLNAGQRCRRRDARFHPGTFCHSLADQQDRGYAVVGRCGKAASAPGTA